MKYLTVFLTILLVNCSLLAQDSTATDSMVQEEIEEVLIEKFSGPDSDVEAVAISPNGKYLAAGGWDNSIYIISLDTADWGELIHVIPFHSSAILSLAFNRNGEYLICGSNDYQISIWNVDSAVMTQKLKQKKGITNVGFGPNIRYALSGSKDGEIKLWDTKDSKRTVTIDAGSSLNSFVLSRDKKSVYVANSSINISQYNRSGVELTTLEGHTRRVNDIAISASGQMLASASDDKTVIIWNLQTRKIKYKLTGHSKKVNTVTFSSDNKYAISGSNDGKVIIWDLSTGEIYRTFDDLGKRVRDVSMSRFMDYVAVACYEEEGDLYGVYLCKTGLQNTKLLARKRNNGRKSNNR
jgi:WD40 repeat protein